MAQTESESYPIYTAREQCTMHDCYSCGVFIQASEEERELILNGYDYEKMPKCADCSHRPTLTCNYEEGATD